MPGMPMPKWYQEAREELDTVKDKAPDTVSFQPVKLERILDLPNLFAEFDVREGDVLIHLFPRDGLEDEWSYGHYVNLCHNCRHEVPMPRKPSELKPCPSCGRTGLVYIPGRVEEKSFAAFPINARELIKEAVDEVWMGDVAIEEVPELGAFVVQIQSARNTAKLVGPLQFVDKICSALDSLLDRKH